MKIKNIIILIILFLSINMSVYIFTEYNSKNRINLILEEDLKHLQTHFGILYTSQKDISYAISQSILRNTNIIEFLEFSYTATKKENDRNREKLYKQLKEQYRTAKRQGVLQVQFVDKNNISFLRVHKPSKYGDDLTNVREDFKIVRETKKPIRGFTQGRTAHGFRNTFPIFNNDKEYIGAMEVSFSSEKYQWYLNHVSHIHSHFLVNKKLFDAKAWDREDLVFEYEQSAESDNLMITLNGFHKNDVCIIYNKQRLKPYKYLINEKISKGEKFNFYTEYKNINEIISFLPIKNLSDETVAWIVSYKKSDIIKASLSNKKLIRLGTFLTSILIIFLLFKQIKSKSKIDEEKEKAEKSRLLLNEILNTTDNILLITDFKDIKYSNDKFKAMMLLNHTSDYNEKFNHNMLDNLFIQSDNYLHGGLVGENETFIEIYKKTKISDRKVLIFNEKNEPKSYSITIQKLSLSDDFLVTLSDISKIQEEFKKVETKAYIDGLTGIYNRSKFNEIFEKELKRAERYNNTFCLALIDLDKFKLFNDKYGHLIGDEVLISMVNTVNNNIRETDVFARWGGEEFIIMFLNNSLESTKRIVELLKDKIEVNKHPLAGTITASFGLTEYKNGDTSETMFKRCDEALYIAKQNGRNRVEII